MTKTELCCWSNCENPAGGGTHTMIDVPQVGGEPMRATLPVCEEHWFGNWHRDRGQLLAENERLRAAIEDHRRNVQSLGYRVNERTHEPEWGGEYDRRLWAVLPDEPDYTNEKRRQVLSNWPQVPSPNAAQPGADTTEGDA